MRPLIVGVLFAMLAVTSAHGSDADTVKRACDQAGNWLIEQHDLKTGLFGDSEASKEPGVVALVLLGLANSPRKYREPLGPFMTMPVKYLVQHRKENGSIVRKGRDTYNTALAVQALTALENKEHRFVIRDGETYLLKCQSKDGGFTYGDGFRGEGDLSNTWFAVTGIAAGELKDDPAVFAKAAEFVRRCQDNPETNPEIAAKSYPGSGGAYYKPGQSEAGTVKTREGVDAPKPYGSMTAAAIETYAACGLKPDAPEVQAALRWFKNHFSAKENPGVGKEGYFYYVFAFSRAMQAAGIQEIEVLGEDGKTATKVAWASALADALIAMQSSEGWFQNSEARWMENDRILATAYALNALDVCYKVLKSK